MLPSDLQGFTTAWLAGWNSHDVEPTLSHFADDVVFTSPVAARILDGSDGVIRGKDALRAYWQEALRRVPDLRFELLGAYAGVDTLVINYRNQVGGLVNEVLQFGPDGTVTAGHGTYLDAGPGLAGLRD
jgi:hypothetical protein